MQKLKINSNTTDKSWLDLGAPTLIMFQLLLIIIIE